MSSPFQHSQGFLSSVGLRDYVEGFDVLRVAVRGSFCRGIVLRPDLLDQLLRFEREFRRELYRLHLGGFRPDVSRLDDRRHLLCCPWCLLQAALLIGPKFQKGSAYDGQAFLWHTRGYCRNPSERTASPFGKLIPPKENARASREAISLRTLLRAQSLRGHNGTWSYLDTESVGIRDVGKRSAFVMLIGFRFFDDGVEREADPSASGSLGICTCVCYCLLLARCCRQLCDRRRFGGVVSCWYHNAIVFRTTNQEMVDKVLVVVWRLIGNWRIETWRYGVACGDYDW